MGCRCKLPASFSNFHRAYLIVCQSFDTPVREVTVQLLSLESRPLDPESSTLSQVTTSPTTPLVLPHQRLNLHYDFFLIMVFCIRLSPTPPPLPPLLTPCIPNFRCQISPPQMLPLMLSSYPRERADECRSSNLSKPQNVRQLSRRLTFVMTFMSRNAFL